MPSLKHRVNLTLPDDIYAVLDELSRLTGEGKATIITGILAPALPALQHSVMLIAQAHMLRNAPASQMQRIQEALSSDPIDALGKDAKKLTAKARRLMIELEAELQGAAQDPRSVTRGSVSGGDGGQNAQPVEN